MPPRSTGASPTASRSSSRGAKPKTASAQSQSAARTLGTASPEQFLQQLTEMIRSFEPHDENDFEGEGRSFNLQHGVIQRARATAAGIQHVAYNTDFEEEVPKSLSGLVTWCLNLGCTIWEEQLNGGKEFPRRSRLPVGPTPEGAQRGAQKRAAARAARAAAERD